MKIGNSRLTPEMVVQQRFYLKLGALIWINFKIRLERQI